MLALNWLLAGGATLMGLTSHALSARAGDTLSGKAYRTATAGQVLGLAALVTGWAATGFSDGILGSVVWATVNLAGHQVCFSIRRRKTVERGA